MVDNTTGTAIVPTLSDRLRTMALANGRVIGRIKQHVTRTVLSLKDAKPDDAFLVAFEGLATQAAPILKRDGTEKTAPDGKPMVPPFLCDIENLQTGEKQVIIMNAVLRSELERAYPNGDYVGRAFAIARTGKGGGVDNRYATFRIVELEVDGFGELRAAGKGAIVAEGDAIQRAKDDKAAVASGASSPAKPPR